MFAVLYPIMQNFIQKLQAWMQKTRVLEGV